MAEAARRLENALICGVIAWFLVSTAPYVPVSATFATVPIAFFAHLAGIGFGLSVIRTRPYAAIAALGLNLSIWFMPWVFVWYT